jgi:hypothetical protein
MLTSYLVHCPHPGCGWFGSLLPSQDQDSWREALPTAKTASFECPQCQRRWGARVRGDDDVEPLPLDEEPVQLMTK